MVKNKDGYIYYEVKIAYTAKNAIRQALSQLLEYAYYNDKYTPVSKLIIICDKELNEADKKYLQKLKDKFSIPIYYQQYIYGQSELSDVFPKHVSNPET